MLNGILHRWLSVRPGTPTDGSTLLCLSTRAIRSKPFGQPSAAQCDNRMNAFGRTIRGGSRFAVQILLIQQLSLSLQNGPKTCSFNEIRKPIQLQHRPARPSHRTEWLFSRWRKMVRLTPTPWRISDACRGPVSLKSSISCNWLLISRSACSCFHRWPVGASRSPKRAFASYQPSTIGQGSASTSNSCYAVELQANNPSGGEHDEVHGLSWCAPRQPS